jgi:hypothetical protein
MAYYPKYNKKKKTPKADPGALLSIAPFAIEAGKGIYNLFQGAKRKRDARENLEALKESGRLTYEVPKTYQEMVDEPISQEYIEGVEDSRAVNFATAMQNLSRDPRNALPVAMGMERQAAKDRLDILGLQDSARTAALQNLAKAEDVAEEKDVLLATTEAQGLQSELTSAVKQQSEGLEGSLSGVVGGLQTGYNEGLFTQGVNPSDPINIYGEELGGDDLVEDSESAEEGGTTPDEFSHDTNPIDIVQDGEKIGEMTGNEIIMPPDDRAQIEELMARGGGEELVALLQELFSKYDSNVIDGKDQEAQEGATVPPLNLERAQEIEKAMKASSKEVRNLGELPFDEDPTNPAGLINFINNKLSFDIDSTNKAEIDFIRKYRDFMIKEQGRTDVPRMNEGGYLAKIKSRLKINF